MAGRIKIILAFTLLGFFAGVVAWVTYKNVAPILVNAFPFLLSTEWFLSGIAGAAFTLIVIVLWAYASK